MIKIRLLTYNEFLKIHDQWNSLLLLGKNPPFFCLWEWIMVWLKHFEKHHRPNILVAEDSGEIISILPLAKCVKSINKYLPPLRVLSFCSSFELAPDFMDIIGSDENVYKSLPFMFKYLCDHDANWDIIYLSYIGKESRVYNWLKREKYSLFEEKTSEAPFIALKIGYENYIKKFNSKRRYNLKRQKAKIDAAGVVFKKVQSVEQQPEILKSLFELHKLRKKKQKTKSLFNNEKVQEFHLDFNETIKEQSYTRLFYYSFNDEVISVKYGFSFQNRFIYYQTGIDPEWEKESVGSMLLNDVIKYLCEDKYEEFDFLRGTEPYKYRWTKESRDLFNVKIYNEKLIGRVHKSLMLGKQKLKSLFSKLKH